MTLPLFVGSQGLARRMFSVLDSILRFTNRRRGRKQPKKRNGGEREERGEGIAEQWRRGQWGRGQE